MKKLFIFDIDNVIDIITNSSSELFVLQANEKSQVIEMIEAVYPEFRNEYEEPIHISEMTASQIDGYVSYKFGFNTDLEQKYAELTDNMSPSELYTNWEEKKKQKYWYPNLSDKGAELIKKKLDPTNNSWFLYSINENPDFEMQDRLSSIATRYHLG